MSLGESSCLVSIGSFILFIRIDFEFSLVTKEKYPDKITMAIKDSVEVSLSFPKRYNTVVILLNRSSSNVRRYSVLGCHVNLNKIKYLKIANFYEIR